MAGHYRTVNVVITGSQYNDRLSACENVPNDMQNLVVALQTQREKLHPVEYATWLHRSFIIIHPFADGNGRVARLLLNHALISLGFPLVIISPMFKHGYIQALEQSHEREQVFTEYIAEQVLQAQRDYIRLLRLA